MAFCDFESKRILGPNNTIQIPTQFKFVYALVHFFREDSEGVIGKAEVGSLI